MPKGRELAGIIIVVVFASAAATFALTTSIPTSSCTASSGGTVRVFNVIASVDGYNGSKSQGGIGPSMQAMKCDVIVINLVNRDVQAHGLSVEFYASNGVESLGGQTVTLRFLASTAGQFRVYCNTVCSVHAVMQHGLLTIV